MPSHIDVRLGHWAKSIVANQKAMDADRRYREQAPTQGFYHVYMAHNHHMLAYSAMMCGQSKRAIDAINEMARGIPAQWLQENAAVADGNNASDDTADRPGMTAAAERSSGAAKPRSRSSTSAAS